MNLTFKTSNGRFNYRVGAIIIYNNSILMVKNNKSPYYYSVGGRVHLNETSEDAIKREVFEEVGLHLDIDRLAFIHENLFIEDITKERFHEISFYYIMKTTSNLDTICMSFDENGNKESLVWISLDNIQNEYLYPEFFKIELKNLSNGLKQILTKNF